MLPASLKPKKGPFGLSGLRCIDSTLYLWQCTSGNSAKEPLGNLCLFHTGSSTLVQVCAFDITCSLFMNRCVTVGGDSNPGVLPSSSESTLLLLRMSRGLMEILTSKQDALNIHPTCGAPGH